jgi:hypothetical protein
MTLRSRWTVVVVLVVLSVSYAEAQIVVPQSIRRMVDSVSAENLTEHVRRLAQAGGLYTRVRHTAGSDSGVAYIKRQFEAIPHLTSVTVDTFSISPRTGFTTRCQSNITATIAGTQNPARICVIGAHHDCSGSRMGSSWNSQWNTMRVPGADDNATGVAVLLELARLMSDPSFGYHPAWTIRFIAFAAEESSPADAVSHVGSRLAAQRSAANLEDVAGMVSVDMIGYNPQYSFQSIIANVSSESLGRTFVAANDTIAVGLTTGLTVQPSATYSDHDSYWNQGYRAVCFIEYAPPWNDGQYYTANPFYHTSSDTLGTVNMSLVAKVAKMTLAAVGGMAAPVTSIAESAPNFMPKGFALEQNYPNPFNPWTVVCAEWPVASEVKLVVYDIVGREVATLADGQFPAGRHTFTFDATGLASGVYTYRLTAGPYSQSRRMVLVR